MSRVSIQREWAERFGRSEPKLICVGLNYRDHAEERGIELPASPPLFAKTSNALGDNGDDIRVPPFAGHVDGEAELAVVIGREAAAVSADDALDFVAGYTCANDVSARDIQFGDGQWYRGKSFDGFCPVGPHLVPTAELEDASDLRIVQRVNGEPIQDSSTSMLIFGVRQLLAFITQAITLEPGDLILTGTPAGVGIFSLSPGDLVEIEIEAIGALRNPVVRGDWSRTNSRKASRPAFRSRGR